MVPFSKSLSPPRTRKFSSLDVAPSDNIDGACKVLVPPLPEKLLVGYCNWNQCDESILRAVEDGVNVVIWFAINLSDGPAVTNGPDMECVARMMKAISDNGFEVVHLISIGGWNSPHPCTMHSAEETFAYFDHWNKKIAARPELGFHGFHGIDWDIEGNDDVDSRFNHFSSDVLNLMGRFSQLAKQMGYLVAMAPAESYLDPSQSGFDLSLLHEYPEWAERDNHFAYHGRNAYAYLLAKFGQTTTLEDLSDGAQVDTFDFVTVQLYEGFSHAQFYLGLEQKNPSEYLCALVERFAAGWEVDFSECPDVELASCRIEVPHTKLVLGLANAWAGDGKFLFLSAEAIEKAYMELRDRNIPVRGFAFWNIKDEGLPSPGAEGTAAPVFLARGLNRFLGIRQQT